MKERARMLREIEAEILYTRQQTGRGAFAESVLDAMRLVPRDRFVPDDPRRFAYDNSPLSIGYSQTISQPFIVALMTDLLDPDVGDVVLEVGTGSGYQSAVLSQLVGHVYTLEIIEPLALRATALFAELGYDNISCRLGNGYHGWLEAAPYDSIIVTAAAPSIPAALINQLCVGGRLVIPIGPPYGYQELVVVDKRPNGEVTQQVLLGVAFVPMIGV